MMSPSVDMNHTLDIIYNFFFLLVFVFNIFSVLILLLLWLRLLNNNISSRLIISVDNFISSVIIVTKQFSIQIFVFWLHTLLTRCHQWWTHVGTILNDSLLGSILRSLSELDQRAEVMKGHLVSHEKCNHFPSFSSSSWRCRSDCDNFIIYLACPSLSRTPCHLST